MPYKRAARNGEIGIVTPEDILSVVIVGMSAATQFHANYWYLVADILTASNCLLS